MIRNHDEIDRPSSVPERRPKRACTSHSPYYAAKSNRTLKSPHFAHIECSAPKAPKSSLATLKILEDEDLVEIFRYLDFAKQTELRRTCRRWLTLLSSPSVLRTIIFEVPIEKTGALTYEANYGCHKIDYKLLTELLQKASKHTELVIFIRESDTAAPVSTSRKKKKKVEPVIVPKTFNHFYYVKRIIESVCGVKRTGRIRRVLFRNLFQDNEAVPDWKFPKSVTHLIFRDCVFKGAQAWVYLANCTGIEVEDEADEFVFAVEGEYILDLPENRKKIFSLSFDDHALIKKLAEENARPLSVAEMRKFRKGIPKMKSHQDMLRMFLNAQCQWYQPKTKIKVKENLLEYKFRQLKPIILRIVEIWMVGQVGNVMNIGGRGHGGRDWQWVYVFPGDSDYDD